MRFWLLWERPWVITVTGEHSCSSETKLNTLEYLKVFLSPEFHIALAAPTPEHGTAAVKVEATVILAPSRKHLVPKFLNNNDNLAANANNPKYFQRQSHRPGVMASRFLQTKGAKLGLIYPGPIRVYERSRWNGQLLQMNISEWIKAPKHKVS